MWTNEKREIRLNKVQVRTKEIGSNVHYVYVVPHQYIIPASIPTTDQMANGKTTYKENLLGLCQNREDLLGNIVSEHILVYVLISMLQMPGTIVGQY